MQVLTYEVCPPPPLSLPDPHPQLLNQSHMPAACTNLFWVLSQDGAYPLNLEDLAQVVCITAIELLVYVLLLLAKAVTTTTNVRVLLQGLRLPGLNTRGNEIRHVLLLRCCAGAGATQ
jgi:hypothetical protein